MALTSYKWAAGFGVALGSMPFVEDDLYPYLRGRRVAPRSQPVDPYPVRTMVQAGYELGDGRIDHAWEMTLLTDAIEYIIETKFSLTATTYAACTINTRRHERDNYTRYNAYIILPKPGQDIVYVRQGVFRVTFRFTGLAAL